MNGVVPIMTTPDNGGRCPSNMVNKYGTWMRKNDPIMFSVSYNENVKS